MFLSLHILRRGDVTSPKEPCQDISLSRFVIRQGTLPFGSELDENSSPFFPCHLGKLLLQSGSGVAPHFIGGPQGTKDPKDLVSLRVTLKGGRKEEVLFSEMLVRQIPTLDNTGTRASGL